MVQQDKAFSGFSVRDLEEARRFYGDVLGLEVVDGGPGFTLAVAGGGSVLVYPSPGHRPASYTVLNFPVGDIEAEVDALTARGVVFETYAGTPMATDEKGVFRRGGPLIAWFQDPSGNVLSVLEEQS
jgi:catechol 2,3-dioxygenase-like lactoylglutathione lyase family enzyme